MPLPASVPVRSTLTERVSPPSMSLSLVSTLPFAALPALALPVPPASTAVAVSSTPPGASLTGDTLSATTSVALEKALLPPDALALTVSPALADVRSQARTVRPSATAPSRLGVGRKYTRSAGPSNSAVESDSAGITCQVPPLSVE